MKLVAHSLFSYGVFLNQTATQTDLPKAQNQKSAYIPA
ncbi:MAG: hypothetical protein HLUCCX10_00565 [Algoriphagus marincola HL-49]|uniref:Uncharacterized protein n=1 Tax=Algoriphagus marincola HL-49 TaxID=1305737 RepID=A0A0P7XS32_9BACT|nr:MAG: hypothetical protein HLUCCX10_00565 [Algoriphagus marincola HL-49]